MAKKTTKSTKEDTKKVDTIPPPEAPTAGEKKSFAGAGARAVRAAADAIKQPVKTMRRVSGR
jgi:hypothetical protein